MIKTNEESSKYLKNPRRELYDSRDNFDIYRNVFAGIKEALSSNWIRYDFKRTYYYDFKEKVIISNNERVKKGDDILDSFRLFTFNINNYSKNKVVSKYKQMVKERNYENLDFSWDELYAEVHFIFKKKIEKLQTIVIPDVSYSNDQLSFRLIDGNYCYTEVDSNVVINALLKMTYSDYTFKNLSYRIEQFESLISKYNITIQDVNYFFEKNAKFQYSLGNLFFICKFVSKGTVLEVIKILLLRGNSKSELINRITKHRDGYVNDEDIQFFVDYIQNLPDN